MKAIQKELGDSEDGKNELGDSEDGKKELETVLKGKWRKLSEITILMSK
jgi:hypothetical protein